MRLPTVKIFHFATDQYTRDWATQAAEILVGFGYTVEVIPAEFNGCKMYRPDSDPAYADHDERAGGNAISFTITLYQLYMDRLRLSGPTVEVKYVELIT